MIHMLENDRIRRANSQKKTSRTCILVSKKDGTEYPFRSLFEADDFLNRAHGYIAKKHNCGLKAYSALDENKEEPFDIIMGPKTKLKVPVQPKREQLCWSCKKCYGFCNWSEKFEPVEGWEAIPVNKTETGVSSYEIISCPEYESDRK